MSEKLRDELAELMNYVDEQAQVLRALDRELDPYWRRQNELTTTLIKTHPWITGKDALDQGRGADPNKCYVIGFGQGIDRRDLFAEFDRLTEVFGPIRVRRRTVKAEIDASLRAAECIQNCSPNRPGDSPKRRPTSFGILHDDTGMHCD